MNQLNANNVSANAAFPFWIWNFVTEAETPVKLLCVHVLWWLKNAHKTTQIVEVKRLCGCGILTPADVSRSWAEVVEKAPCGFSSWPLTQMQNNPQNSPILFSTCGVSLCLFTCSLLFSASALSVCRHTYLPLSLNALYDSLSLSLSGFGMWFSKSPCWWLLLFKVASCSVTKERLSFCRISQAT